MNDNETTTGYADGHLEPAANFPYEEVFNNLDDKGDRGNPIMAEITEASFNCRELDIVRKFRRAIAEIYATKDSKKSALMFLIATGDEAAEGIKVLEAGKQFGVSKQDISKGCVEWCKFMGIEPSTYMRAQSSKESFRNANRRNQ